MLKEQFIPRLTLFLVTGECPISHPFAYWAGGQWCCATNRDNKGNPISLESRHCENQNNTRCPDSKYCVNHQGQFKTLFHFDSFT